MQAGTRQRGSQNSKLSHNLSLSRSSSFHNVPPNNQKKKRLKQPRHVSTPPVSCLCFLRFSHERCPGPVSPAPEARLSTVRSGASSFAWRSIWMAFSSSSAVYHAGGPALTEATGKKFGGKQEPKRAVSWPTSFCTNKYYY